MAARPCPDARLWRVRPSTLNGDVVNLGPRLPLNGGLLDAQYCPQREELQHATCMSTPRQQALLGVDRVGEGAMAFDSTGHAILTHEQPRNARRISP